MEGVHENGSSPVTGCSGIQDSKTAAGKRQLKVPEVLVPHLLRLATGRAQNTYLFSHAQHRARAQDWAREQVEQMCKLAAVPRVTPHGLRGTIVTIAREASATSQLVTATLGHASPAITEAAYIDCEPAASAERASRARRRTAGD
jgi:integrase